jgi:hypothetical protein
VRRRWIRLLVGLGLVWPAATLRADRVPIGDPVRGFASPGDYPEGLCWDGSHLWSNNFTDGRLYKLDPRTGVVVASYGGGGLPRKPEGLAWDGEHVWTCDWETGRIFKLKETDGQLRIVSFGDKPAGSGPAVGLTWDGQSLWLSTWGSELYERGQLWKLDPATLQPVEMLRLPVHWVEDLAWDGCFIWSVDWLYHIGFAIDPATGDTLHTYRTPGRNPVGQAWDGTHLWLSDTRSDSLWALDISGARPTVVQSASWSDVKQVFRAP